MLGKRSTSAFVKTNTMRKTNKRARLNATTHNREEQVDERSTADSLDDDNDWRLVDDEEIDEQIDDVEVEDLDLDSFTPATSASSKIGRARTVSADTAVDSELHIENEDIQAFNADDEGMVDLSDLLPDEPRKSSSQNIAIQRPVERLIRGFSKDSNNRAVQQEENDLNVETAEMDQDDDESTVHEKRNQLISVMSKLSSQALKSTAVPSSSSTFAFDPQDVIQENEFAAVALPSSSISNNKTSDSFSQPHKLTLNDLLSSLQRQTVNEETGDVQSIIKNRRHRQDVAQIKSKLDILLSSQTNANAQLGVVSQPLPETQQAQLSRRVAYEQSKEEIELRWSQVQRQQAQQAHLTFPLPLAGSEPTTAQQNSALLQHVNANQEGLEADLLSIMKRASSGSYSNGHQDQQEEEQMLQERTLSKGEIEARRSHLARMKSLLFFNELKVRRMNKIKSKTFRKLKRKERHNAELSLEQLQELDPSLAEEKQRKLELTRIQERMSLAHSNSSSWMKRQLRVNAAAQNPIVQEALREHTHREQALKQRMQSIEVADVSDADVARESDEDVELQHSEDQHEMPVSKASHLQSKIRMLTKAGSLESEDATTGLCSLPFMKRALNKQKAAAATAHDDLAAQLREELQRVQQGDHDDDAPTLASTVQVTIANAALNETKTLDTDPEVTQHDAVSFSEGSFQTSRVALNTGIALSFAPQDNAHQASDQLAQPHDDDFFLSANPWSADPSSSSSRQEMNKLQERSRKPEWVAGAKLSGSKTHNIDFLDSFIKDGRSSGPAKPREEAHDTLVAEAFATAEDEDMNFQRSKAEQVNDQVGDIRSSLQIGQSPPGWGAWHGVGVQPPIVSERQARRAAVASAALQQSIKQRLDTRADAKLPRVIISERSDKKAVKYLVPTLPYPYTSAQGFESTISQPIGREWNAYTAHQQAVAPRLQIKIGTEIRATTAAVNTDYKQSLRRAVARTAARRPLA